MASCRLRLICGHFPTPSPYPQHRRPTPTGAVSCRKSVKELVLRARSRV